MEPLDRIRETAKGIAQILRATKETSKETMQIINTLSESRDILGRISSIGYRSKPLPEDERSALMEAVLDAMVKDKRAKQTLIRVIDEYKKAYEHNKMTDDHRKVIIKHLRTHTSPKDLEKIHKILKAINSAEKEHVDILVRALDQHGLEKVHPIAQEYLHEDPNMKKIIAEELRRAENENHLTRIQYHIDKLKEIPPEVKKRVADLIKNTKNFEEVDRLIMVAHHASKAISFGGKREDILSAFDTKERAFKQFREPWKGWEPM